MRKIIQINTTGVNNTYNTQCDYVTTALCNDGTVWVKHDQSDSWQRLPLIPQESFGYEMITQDEVE